MILRSLLFVPADSEKKLAKSRDSKADALILDLEDSVAPENRPRARELARAFLGEPHAQSVWVRINSLHGEDFPLDLETIVPGKPAGFIIPKPDGPKDLNTIDKLILDHEISAGIPHGGIKMIPVATETPAAVLNLSEYQKPVPRLAGMTWGAEDLAAALGAVSNRDSNGEFLFTYKMVRALCLIAAKAAGVPAIETLHADFHDAYGLENAARTAQREGFSGMLAIHPAQVGIINAAFTPSEADVEHAKRVIAAFAEGAGVASLDGKMLDQPHLKQAHNILTVHEALRARV